MPRLTILNRKQLVPQIFEISFGLRGGGGTTFTAGQYSYISIPGLTGDPMGSGRTFSMCSSPNDKQSISVAFRLSGSPFKQFLATAPIGTEVDVTGPFGNFVLPIDHFQLVFIAGGIGITPFLSMLKYAAEEKLPHKILLLYANKDPENIAYLDELEKIKKQNPNLIIQLHAGNIDEEALANIKNLLPESHWYISGPPAMTDDVSDMLVSHNVSRQDIYFEESNLTFIIETIKRIGILEQSSDGIIISDLRGIIKYVNPTWQNLMGWNAEEVINKSTPRIIKSGKYDIKFYEQLWQIVMNGQVFRGEIANKRKNGDLYDTDEIIFSIKSASGGLIGLVAFQRDISERKRAEAKIKELNELRNKFIQIVSHQLRTPLNSIRWNLEILLAEELGKLKNVQKEFLRITYEANIEVIRRIHDLLTAIDIEEERVITSKEDISLENLWGSIMSEWKKKCAVKDITCEYQPPKEPLPSAEVDAEKIREVFNKLTENAVIYTPNKRKITATLKKTDGTVRFEIVDTGIGIPKTEQSHIFTRFYRATNAPTMKSDASGLGLATSKYYIEQHGGKIGFESEEGKGSTFWFELPLK